MFIREVTGKSLKTLVFFPTSSWNYFSIASELIFDSMFNHRLCNSIFFFPASNPK